MRYALAPDVLPDTFDGKEMVFVRVGPNEEFNVHIKKNLEVTVKELVFNKETDDWGYGAIYTGQEARNMAVTDGLLIEVKR